MSGAECSTALTSNSFTYAGTSYQILRVVIATAQNRLTLTLDQAIPSQLDTLSLNVGSQSFSLAAASNSSSIISGDAKRWDSSGLSWSSGDTVSLSLVDPTVTPTQTQTAASAVVIDPTQRSWPLTAIADEGASEWWFPIGRGKCDMKDEERPWTWDQWNPPTADQCGWLSIPDVRSGLDEPVDELAFSVYTALIASPDIGGSAAVDRPSGPSVKLAVWAVYPEWHYNLYNWTRRLAGTAPLTVCLPGDEGQSIHAYDEAEGEWVELESVEAEREGHICGLYRHDLGLIVVSSD